MGEPNVKLHDVIKCYSGDEDVSVWLSKFGLVTKLRKLANLEEVLPLFLEGPAFAVYDQMKEDDKEDSKKIEAALKDAFAASPFRAFDEPRSRLYREGESADVYLSELRRLAALAAIRDDAMLRCAFVTGLPQPVSAQLQATPGIQTMALDEVMVIARALLSHQTDPRLGVATGCSGAAAAAQSSGGARWRQKAAAKTVADGAEQGDATTWQPVRCHQCGGPHLRKRCPLVECFRCGENGHMARDCSQAGNDHGKL